MVACLGLDPEEEDLEMPLDGELGMEIGEVLFLESSSFFVDVAVDDDGVDCDGCY